MVPKTPESRTADNGGLLSTLSCLDFFKTKCPLSAPLNRGQPGVISGLLGLVQAPGAVLFCSDVRLLLFLKLTCCLLMRKLKVKDSFLPPVLSSSGISVSQFPQIERDWLVSGWEWQPCLVISSIFRHMQVFRTLLPPSHISIWALGSELPSHFYSRETFSGLADGTALNEICVYKFFHWSSLDYFTL